MDDDDTDTLSSSTSSLYSSTFSLASLTEERKQQLTYDFAEKRRHSLQMLNADQEHESAFDNGAGPADG